MEPLYWLILLAIFLVIEIITLGLTTIWLAGGALVGFLAAVLHVPLPIQIVLFLVVSTVDIRFDICSFNVMRRGFVFFLSGVVISYF